MARKRYQKGFVYLDGDKWKGRYREDRITGEGTKRIRREVILGCKREMTKPLAERRMEVVLARHQWSRLSARTCCNLRGVFERWKAEVLTKQQAILCASSEVAPASATSLPQLGKLRLDQFGVENQQTFLTRVFGATKSRVS